MKILLALVTFALMAAPVSAQQMYRWVDEHGKVQYSDQPPEKAKSSKKLDIPNKPAAPSSNTEKSAKDKELEFRKRQSDAASADEKQKKAEEEKRAAAVQCDAARKSLRSLEEGGGRVVTYNEKGERTFMSDSERETAIANSRKSVAEWCK